ncbi:MAG TPA: hemerythrin domain-containing protein [Micromonosporaceae bacterium]|jgi:hypothetical protein
MSHADPILYPLPRGSAESVRQDVFRTRADLAETIGELAARFHPRAFIRARLKALWTASKPVVGGAAALLSSVIAGEVVSRRAQERAVRVATRAGFAAAGVGAAALTYTSLRRRVDPDLIRTAQPLGTVEPSRTSLYRGRAASGRGPAGDVVDLLSEQHKQLLASFDLVAANGGADDDRREAFASLVQLLNRHERAEQEIVHPVIAAIAGGSEVASARLDEENVADRTLASLISRGVDDGGFLPGLHRLRDLVEAHARHEEAYEFPLLRARLDGLTLRRMANRVHAAQSGQW